MNQGQRKPPSHLLMSALILLLLLGGLEGGMRALGYFLQRPRNLRNLPVPEDKNKLRILALGESTTDDYFAPGVNMSWPGQLEAMLKKRGIEARVYNEGLGATQSAFILARLQEYLREYQPHLVITMMGVNDMPGVVYGDTFLRRAEAELSQFRLFKLYRWVVAAARSSFSPCRLSRKYFPEHQEKVGRGFQLSLRLPAAEVEARLRAFIQNDSEMAVVMSAISARKRGDITDPHAKEHALPYAERAFQLDPHNHWTIFHSLIGSSLPPALCEKVVRSLVPCQEFVPDNLLTIVAACFSMNPGLYVARQIWTRGIAVENGKGAATADHYRRLLRILQERGIPLIAMQYPTRPLSELQAYFEDGNPPKTGITFVSNEENFLRALSGHPYTDLFIDRFAKTWGHTTIYGHRLIAEELLPVVERLASKNTPLKQFSSSSEPRESNKAVTTLGEK